MTDRTINDFSGQNPEQSEESAFSIAVEYSFPIDKEYKPSKACNGSSLDTYKLINETALFVGLDFGVQKQSFCSQNKVLQEAIVASQTLHLTLPEEMTFPPQSLTVLRVKVLTAMIKGFDCRLVPSLPKGTLGLKVIGGSP